MHHKYENLNMAIKTCKDLKIQTVNIQAEDFVNQTVLLLPSPSFSLILPHPDALLETLDAECPLASDQTWTDGPHQGQTRVGLPHRWERRYKYTSHIS